MNPSQRRFLDFHRFHVVTAWRWHFLQTQLRAFDDLGRSATIWCDDVEELVSRRLMVRGHGCADYHITQIGRAELALAEA